LYESFTLFDVHIEPQSGQATNTPEHIGSTDRRAGPDIGISSRERPRYGGLWSAAAAAWRDGTRFAVNVDLAMVEAEMPATVFGCRAVKELPDAVCRNMAAVSAAANRLEVAVVTGQRFKLVSVGI
jgi:hypothetical protein